MKLDSKPAQAEISPWVKRFVALLPDHAEVLDYASGHGRHARWLASMGHQVLAVDRNAAALATIQGAAGVNTLVAELEEELWPLYGQRFDGVVVTNYLFRPRLPDVLGLLRVGGVLIYETFMVGNERFGRPRRADFLLRHNELLEILDEQWTVLAFEQGVQQQPRPAAVQRICAVRSRAALLELP